MYENQSAHTLSQLSSGESLIRLGFALIPDAFNTAHYEPLIERLTTTQLGTPGTRCLLDDSAVSEFAQDVAAWAGERLGLDATLEPLLCTYFHKSLDQNWFVPWHQDRSVPVRALRGVQSNGRCRSKEGREFLQADAAILQQLLAIRLHLDDSTTANGPLRVIPGSHAYGVLTPSQIETWTNKAQSVEVCAARGQILAIRPLLLHSSRKCTEDQPRRVLHFLLGSGLSSPRPDAQARPIA